MKAHLDLQDESDALEYDWMDTNIMGTSLTISTEASTNAFGVVVENPLEWLALPTEMKIGYALLLTNV